MSSPTKIPFLSFIQIDKKSNTPLYMQIANQFSNAIQRNYLLKGTKLPGTRKLSELLQINRNTVIAAYDELQAQGWIESKANKGTFVIEKTKNTPVKLKNSFEQYSSIYPDKAGFAFKQSNILDSPYEKITTKYYFTDGTPDNRLVQINQLSSFYSASIKRKTNKKKLNNSSYENNAFFLKNMANYLNLSRGLQINTQNILITNSSEMSLYIAAETLLSKEDKIIVTDLSYFSSNMTFQNKGAKVLTAGVDEEGIIIQHVENLCKKHKIRLLYITPHHHYPTTVTLSPQRRVQLLHLANKYGFVILEDDYDYEFHYDKSPIVPLASSDKNGMVVYTGSFGHSLIPGFKLGFIVAPKDVIHEMQKHLNVINPQGDILMQQVLAELIEEGEISRYLKKATKVYQERRNYFCKLLNEYFPDQISFNKPSGGLAVWVNWNKEINLYNLMKIALNNNLSIPKTLLYQNKDIRATRLGFGHLDKDEIEIVLSILHHSVNQL
ncbi:MULTISPECIES: PLP-dependent aminotransferase family protein [Myroides]|uniref:Aminotransferase class I/II-fold pyridoxal phosphate-dependent enzyme n=1 Tax=Myroides albus TaxID=2562892 RepID=A0A6I3LM49_9FLAO|nr:MULTISPECIES: PLP-dependent aminotransferase family protein [Myroides]MTG98767.1 aminotransferase class I/II-fold pyridoxal phosphate-dependent enzyme [Myroides albus]MVX35896.1 aminotransferase class I/II-fold pyridoxal phosphate-dependent enzyme [Myroides sp. LoEW2-1]UVD79916.1 PLP-dependent aminotransferase family protein [Myroides albus]